jgi:hypothetical protein
MIIISVLAATLATAPTGPRTTAPRAPTDGRTTSTAEFKAFVARHVVPSFSRQTKLACTACHNGFPQLTPFGRLFKLNGYTMTGLPSITAQADSASRKQLDLPPIAPLSVMAIISGTHVSKATPDAQSTTAQFPQEISLFAAAAISDKVGIFSQFTYEDESGTIGIDNVDIRFANHAQVSGKDVLYGLTLHNNPTIQDVWNTTPGWAYPFTSAAAAPSPAAELLIDGALGQSVLGLGAYSLYNNTLYAELTGYVAAPQEAALPLDAGATNTPKAVSPYFRLALQHQFTSTYAMIGAFGLDARMYPTGVSGLSNHYTDLGLDAQIERKVGVGTAIGRATYIHERQRLAAAFASQEAEHEANSLNGYKVNVSYLPSQTHSFSVGLFGTTGTTDNVLYPSAPVTGSSTGRPGSAGEVLEYALTPWLNTRLAVQYVAYQKFNGASGSYDVSPDGRSARDNNTLYCYLWFAY